MATIEEKRVYAGGERTTLYLATALGVATVSVSDDRIGEFGVERREEARDVAGANGLLAAACGDVLVGADLVETGFGPARAVGTDGESVLATDGERVGRYDGEWSTIGEAEGKRFDGNLLAAEDAYRVGEGLEALGCPAAPNDVCAAGDAAFAASDDGLYRFDGEWERELAGPCRVVAAGGDFAAGPEAGDFWGRSDGGWRRLDTPATERIADTVRTPEGTYAVTESGTVLANAGEGWRSRETGLRGVRSLAAPSVGADGEP
jgi:hypothetical protein